jgi:hypothetical protein
MSNFQTDAYGSKFTTADNSPPTAGGTIYVPDSNGNLVQSTWMGQVIKK